MTEFKNFLGFEQKFTFSVLFGQDKASVLLLSYGWLTSDKLTYTKNEFTMFEKLEKKRRENTSWDNSPPKKNTDTVLLAFRLLLSLSAMTRNIPSFDCAIFNVFLVTM